MGGEYSIEGHRVSAPSLQSGLYIVATPIGNLRDVTLRALETLAAADIVACEDTRVSQRLLERYAIRARLSIYHEHNADKAGAALLHEIKQGKSIALISDAGTPLISDPGYRLVRDARQEGLPVWSVPGASAAIAALAASGMPSTRFTFEGFLPAKKGARSARLSSLARRMETIIFYENPSRLGASLTEMAQAFGHERQICVCRELTKLHEEIVTGEAGTLAERYGDARVKGEIVIIVAPSSGQESIDLDSLLLELLERLNVSQAAAEAAVLSGRPKREVYQRALELSGRRSFE